MCIIDGDFVVIAVVVVVVVVVVREQEAAVSIAAEGECLAHTVTRDVICLKQWEKPGSKSLAAGIVSKCTLKFEILT